MKRFMWMSCTLAILALAIGCGDNDKTEKPKDGGTKTNGDGKNGDGNNGDGNNGDGNNGDGDSGNTFKIFGAGNGPFHWELELSDGSRRSLSDDNSDPVTVKPGDTIEWSSGTGFHGVIFGGKSEAEFNALFDVLPGGKTLVLNPGGGVDGWGTAGASADTLLLKVKVKDGVTGTLDFHCSVHGAPMDGKIKFQP